jgi:hypothetical protein
MDCVECQELMQRYLDGEPDALGRAGLAAHLSICPDCRDWYAAAQCLLDGLRFLSPPQPPAALMEQICRQIVAERVRAARFRRLRVISAVAAGLLLVCSAAYLGLRAISKVDTQAELTRLRPDRSLPSLQHRIEEAGLAVVALTRRTADETMSETKLLLPMNIPQASVGDSQELEHALEPPAQSLWEIQEGMTAGLEPVATSARRAVGFFLSSRQWAVSTRQ